ncbi:fibronectin type III domain-containing protein, partial [Rathayibacter sp. AY1A3]|uniref:fibronectin type III domain-containing protein n=1 Tax=Rathayibacter sp. AY1A3 TaxID=2080521 RepID=UPI000D4F1BF8
WAQYTTVITADSIRGYLDGVAMGPAVPKTTRIAEFAGPLSVLIGKSNYRTDPTYAGSFRDLRVFDEALTAEQVAALHSADLVAPTVQPSSVSGTSSDDSVSVSWTGAPAGSGRAPVSGYRVTLTPVGGGTAVTDSLPATARTAVLRGVAEGSYTIAVRAENAAGTGPAATAAAPVTSGPARSDADWVAAARAALLAAPAFSAQERSRVSGALTLPGTLAELQGRDAEPGADRVAIAWTSSDDAVVSDTDTPSGSTTEGLADVVEKGAVVRGAADASVTLTAVISRGTATSTLTLPLTVLAAPAATENEAYLFAYFSGNSTDQQQIRFATTDGNDALDWTELNDGAPVLTSSQGTRGLRDPSIVRSVEGDRFFLLATDLDITKTTWPESFTNGSKHLEIWESTNLVNWSEQRHIEVSPEWAGMTWAPEAQWDESIGQYVVYWSSRVYPEGQPHVTGAPGTTDSRIVYATTRDFRTFSEPQVWVGSGDRIDATVLKQGDDYFRFTKEVSGDAGCQDIVTERSTSLRSTYVDYPVGGDWSVVENCVARNAGYDQIVEGPTVFPANEGDVNGSGYYLFADWFTGTGYQAFHTEDVSQPGWTYLDPAADDRVSLPASPRHGSVIGISREERDAVLGAYQPELLVTSVAPVAQDVRVGSTSTTLPATVQATFTGGRTEQVAVAWEAFDASVLDRAGEALVVRGTLANGAATRAVATLTAVGGVEVTASAVPRCVAGKVVLTVTTTNRGTEPAAVRVVTSAGTKSIAALAPGARSTTAFSTRSPSVSAGSATVTATTGESSASVSALYGALNCR